MGKPQPKEFGLEIQPLFVCVLVVQSCLTLCDPMDCSLPAPLSMELSRREYWSG